MSDTVPHSKLTHGGALKLLQAAIAKAQQMGVPQCIAVVDDGGNMLAFVRMDGSRVLSIDSSTRKAMTAATNSSERNFVIDSLILQRRVR